MNDFVECGICSVASLVKIDLYSYFLWINIEPDEYAFHCCIILSRIRGLRGLKDGIWIWWSNLSVLYTTCYNISQIAIFNWTLSTSDFQLNWTVSSGQSQSYVTTDGQSANLSWNKATIWGLRPDLYNCETVAGLLMWGALSDERTGLSFANITVSSNKPVVSMYNLHFTYH
jgi:hypothetical protein